MSAIFMSKKKFEEERFQQEHARKPSEDRMHKNNTTETQGAVDIIESNIYQKVVKK